MHHQPTTQTTLLHLLALPPVLRVCLLRPSVSTTPSTPRNTTVTSRPASCHPTLHLLATLLPPSLARLTLGSRPPPSRPPPPPPSPSSSSMFPCPTTTTTNIVVVVVVDVVVTISAFLYSLRRRHAESTKRGCCYVALGDQQVSSSSSTLSSSLRRRHSPARSSHVLRITLFAIPLTRRVF